MAVVEVPCVISGGVQSGPSLNVWHVQVAVADAAGLGPALADFAAFYTARSSSFATGVTIAVAPDGVKIVDVTPNVIVPVSGTSVNSTGSTPLPGNVAVVAALRTSLAGRSYMGRKFFGPLATAVMDNGLLSSTSRTGWLSSLSTLLSSLDGHGCPLVVWSRLRNTATEVTGFTMDNRLDNLNSRKLTG